MLQADPSQRNTVYTYCRDVKQTRYNTIDVTRITSVFTADLFSRSECVVNWACTHTLQANRWLVCETKQDIRTYRLLFSGNQMAMNTVPNSKLGHNRSMVPYARRQCADSCASPATHVLCSALALLLLVGCLTPQQHASVFQGRIYSDSAAHWEVEDQSFYLSQSQYTDTGPTGLSADPIMPGGWCGSYWSTKFYVTIMNRPGKKVRGESGNRTHADTLPLS